jgi:hypothetical protein
VLEALALGVGDGLDGVAEGAEEDADGAGAALDEVVFADDWSSVVLGSPHPARATRSAAVAAAARTTARARGCTDSG